MSLNKTPKAARSGAARAASDHNTGGLGNEVHQDDLGKCLELCGVTVVDRELHPVAPTKKDILLPVGAGPQDF